MKLLSSLLLLLTTSATLCLAEEAKPNLDDPATLEKIVEKAIDGDMLEKRNPTRRLGEIHEFGFACAWMCSAHSGYLTGQNILIDGGSFNSTF